MLDQDQTAKDSAAALAVEPKGQIIITPHGIDFANFDGLWRVAVMIHRSGFFPKGLNTPEAIAVCIARGRAIGLDAFQSMDSIGVINGKPCVYGDAPLAICRQHPSWDESGFHEEITGEGERMVAMCQTFRKGAATPRMETFSVDDAKKAKLWGKEGPWQNYPKRMLMFRARGYNLRDNFGDALKGISVAELMDEETQTPPPVGQFSLRNGSGPKVVTGTAETPKNPTVNHEPVDTPHQSEQQPAICSKETAQAIRKELATNHGDDIGAGARLLKPYRKHSFDELTEAEAQDVLAELRGVPVETGGESPRRDW